MIGSTLEVFATGGLADWLPAYLTRSDTNLGLLDTSILLFSVQTAASIGSVFAGWCATKASKFISNSEMFVLGIAWLMSACMIIGIFFIQNVGIAVFIFFHHLFDLGAGPLISTIIVNNCATNLRGRALALMVAAAHALGDSLSPVVVGFISDMTGTLSTAMSILPISLGCAGVVMIIGWLLLRKK